MWFEGRVVVEVGEMRSLGGLEDAFIVVMAATDMTNMRVRNWRKGKGV